MFDYIQKRDPKMADDFTMMFNMIEMQWWCFDDILDKAMDLYKQNIYLQNDPLLVYLCVYDAVVQTRNSDYDISSFCKFYDVHKVCKSLKIFKNRYFSFTDNQQVKTPDQN
jgi:hypothetical protein